MIPRHVLVCSLLCSLSFAAEKPKSKKPASSRLTVERIYGKNEFKSASYSARWLPGRDAYVRTEKSKTTPAGRDIVQYEAGSGKRTVLVDAADLIPPKGSTPLKIDGYQFSRDLSLVLIYTNSKRVWRRNTRGDYWVLDRSNKQLQKLGGDAKPATLMFAKFSPTGRQVAYVRERNIYIENLLDDSVRKVTETQSVNIINGTFDWVYEEELSLRDGFRWSPDGKSIAYWQLDTTGVRKVPLVNNTDSFYPNVTWIPYPKTGQRNSASRIGVVDVANGKTRWMKIPGNPREHYIARMDWAKSSRELIVQQLNRLQNTNRVMLVNRLDGKSRTLLVERDKAWIDIHDELRWLRGGKEFTWLSERDGWRHLYLYSREGNSVRQVTEGKFDVIRLLRVDEKRKLAWFITSPKNATQRYLYRVKLDGSNKNGPRKVKRISNTSPLSPADSNVFTIEAVAGERAGVRGRRKTTRGPSPPTPLPASRPSQDRKLAAGRGGPQRVTPQDQPGWHSYNISDSGAWAIHSYSSFDSPPTTELVELPKHRTVRVVETNKKIREKLKKLKHTPVEFFRVKVAPRVELDAYCIKPPKFDPKKKYPLLIYVYGEPAGQTVVDRWGGSNGMWHRLLAEREYVVMSFDNRGTKSPRGRAWRKCVYRKIGIIAPKEQAAAVRAVLKQRPYLDAKRVGIWGWSGGGSSSLQAIFKYPDLYHTAIAVAPVPNQRYYDTIYQERYMGLPRTNVQGYRDGSPINFARNLKGNLLLIHGTGDDNCHYATSELLINELIRHNKQFQMFAYPNRTHSIREGKNTTLHLRRMMTNYLLQKLPATPDR